MKLVYGVTWGSGRKAWPDKC